MLRELRAALDAAHPGVHKELTIAMGMSPAVTGAAPKQELAEALHELLYVDLVMTQLSIWQELAELLDAVNLMTYVPHSSYFLTDRRPTTY